MKKDAFINGALAVSSLLLFALAIEVTLRMTGLQTVTPNPPRIYVQDKNPHISYKLKPNLKNEKAYKATVSTDERGFRLNAELRMKNAESTTIILGDSIAFGYGVNDNQTLAAQLNSTFSLLHSQFINAAVPGYQLEQQRALYEDYVVPHIQHDAVMIVFFWNDLDGLKPGKLDADGILRSNDWQPSNDNRTWLERHSAFYIAYKKLLSLRSSKKHMAEEREHATKEVVVDDNLKAYLQDLRSFATMLPTEKYFVIWPDNLLHTDTKPQLIAGAQAAGFTVIDLYDLFGNTVETLGWDTVHPSANSLKKAAEFIRPLL